MIDKTLILNNIKKLYGFDKDIEFAEHLGIAKSTLASWYTRNTFDIEKLYAKCDRVSPDYLFTGEGSIERVNNTSQAVNVYKLRTDKVVNDQLIPLYNLEASAGIVTLFKDTKEFTPIDYLHIPNLPKCDGSLYVTGDSMYPLLKSGDIIAYKQVHDFANDIFWGEMYLVSLDVSGDEQVMVKYVQRSEKGEEYLKLVSQNKHHQDKDVKFSKVRALALIKASVRINSMS